MKWFLRRATALIPVVALAAMAGSALAQVQRPMTVAVLTFSNSSGVGGALLGNRAAAAVEAQMIETGRYDVVKRELVAKTMEDLNLSFPLGRLGLTQLATRLEADAIATGDVVRVVRDAKTRQVTATLRIELTDRASGELVNGAIAAGESGIRPDFSGAEDVLLDEALNRAAFSAVRTMNERILPEGTVFATSSVGDSVEALLNIGSNSGVRSGMELIVLRNREQVGRLRATRVSPTDSTAVVVSSTRGVQPEDKVRAVFRLENIPVEAGGAGAAATRVSRPRVKVNNLAFGALALLGLYKATQGNLGSGNPGALRATATSTGPYNGAPGANEIPYVPAIRVRWSAPPGVRTQDIIGYGVYRVTEVGTVKPVHITSGALPREFVDDGHAMEVGDGPGNSDAEFGSGKVHGLSAGIGERYLIRTAYYKRTTDSDGSTGEGEVTYADEAYTNSATGLLPPNPISVTGEDVNALVFSFTRVPGGDRYVIQVADNMEFRNPDRYPNTGSGIFQAPPPSTGPVNYWASEQDGDRCGKIDTGGSNVCGEIDPRDPFFWEMYPELEELVRGEMTVNLNTGRLDPPSPGRQLYWRVGVRSSRDDRAPEGGGFVWGDTKPLVIGEATGFVPKAAAPSPVVPPVITNPTEPTPVTPTVPGMRPGAGRGRR